MAAFLYMDASNDGRTGYMVEYGPTSALFESLREADTKAYIRGEFG